MTVLHPSYRLLIQGCSELVQNQVPCYINDRIRLASLVRQNLVPKFVETYEPLSLCPLPRPPPPIYMNKHVYVYIISAFTIEILMLVIKNAVSTCV